MSRQTHRALHIVLRAEAATIDVDGYDASYSTFLCIKKHSFCAELKEGNCSMP